MINVVPGDQVVIIKAGRFLTPAGEIIIPIGTKGQVYSVASGKGKKRWALVEIYADNTKITGRIRMPAWWLRPRSILDDLAEI